MSILPNRLTLITPLDQKEARRNTRFFQVRDKKAIFRSNELKCAFQ